MHMVLDLMVEHPLLMFKFWYFTISEVHIEHHFTWKCHVLWRVCDELYCINCLKPLTSDVIRFYIMWWRLNFRYIFCKWLITMMLSGFPLTVAACTWKDYRVHSHFVSTIVYNYKPTVHLNYGLRNLYYCDTTIWNSLSTWLTKVGSLLWKLII